ncbi:MAG: class I SAM-dependent methyltransferase [bacterium]
MQYSEPYSKMALIYDLMHADHHSLNMVEYTLKIIKRFKINAASCLDLCCGTGSALVEFHKKGYMVSGLDRSAAMLAVAAKKLKKTKVKLYQKSLPNFKILSIDNSTKTEQFDLVTSFYDSLNYLKSETELKQTFRSVANHLVKDGWFIFDMNTPVALKTIWGGQVYAGAQDDLAWIWKNKCDTKTKTASVETTCFYKEGNEWRRFDELHTELSHSNTTLRKLLRETGFTVKAVYRCGTFAKADKDTTRVCIVAQKR